MSDLYKTLKTRVVRVASGEVVFEIDGGRGEVSIKSEEKIIDVEQDQKIFLTLQSSENHEVTTYSNGIKLLNEILTGTF